uniref:Superoxide dismutase [Cu-Zn] n=1 Tax=Paracyclopina nana TaxID=565004 RepID=H2B643_PARNA
MKYQLTWSLAFATAFVVTFASPIQKLLISHSHDSSHQILKAKVKLIAAENTDKPPVYGSLFLIETSEGVYVKGKIIGLEPGKHGFHVHEIGDLGNDCVNAGPHFNPAGNTHGAPNEETRHAGDLGNIETHHVDNSPGTITVVNQLDKVVTLDPKADNGITGRAFVVHALPDDLGLGGDDESLKTGNAGKRLACGIVEPVNY